MTGKYTSMKTPVANTPAVINNYSIFNWTGKENNYSYEQIRAQDLKVWAFGSLSTVASRSVCLPLEIS